MAYFLAIFQSSLPESQSNVCFPVLLEFNRGLQSFLRKVSTLLEDLKFRNLHRIHTTKGNATVIFVKISDDEKIDETNMNIYMCMCKENRTMLFQTHKLINKTF